MANRAMKQPKISDVIFEQVSNMILEGIFKPGQKLPPEREFAEQLSTSRPSLRAALNKLETQGLITRVQGGGNYVSEKMESTFSDPLLELFGDREEFKYDVLEYRHALEEASCYLAAKNATEEDKGNIQASYDRWLQLYKEHKQPEEEAEADLDFHLAIADASHNVVFPHAMRSSVNFMKHSVTISLKELRVAESRAELIEQHEAMLKAILAGDAEAARLAVRKHLDYVKSEMERSDIQMLREQRANRRKGVLNTGS